VDDGYKLPDAPYKFFMQKHNTPPKDKTGARFMVKTSGSDGGFYPFEVRPNGAGVWKVWSASSFFVGTKEPPKAKAVGP
jgi:hypothetical protein